MSKALVKVISPKGEFAWVTITGEGVENMSGRMQYKVDLILDPKNNDVDKAFIDSIDTYWAENKPKGFKKKPKSLGWNYCDNVLDDDGQKVEDDEGKKVYDKDGRVSVVFKTATAWPDGKTKIVKTRNSKGGIVQLGDISIGNGSIGYVAGAMDIYTNETKQGTLVDAGVTFYLDELKITKLEEYSGGAQFGDDTDEEAGWTGEDVDAFAGTDGDAKPRL